MLASTSRRSGGASAGFTLLELVIAVVVVGLLAAVAFPSFMDSIRKGRRSDAFTALSSIQQAQERWRSNNAGYAATLGGLGIASTTPSGYYSLSLDNVGPTGYEAVATAVSGTSQLSDTNCAKLGVQLLNGNIKYASAAAAGTLAYNSTDRCWSR